MLIIIFRKSFKIFREKLILQILLFCVFSQFWEIAFFSFFLFSPSLSLSHTPLSIRYNSIVLTLSLSLTHSLSLCTILHKKFCLSCLNILIASCFFCFFVWWPGKFSAKISLFCLFSNQNNHTVLDSIFYLQKRNQCDRIGWRNVNTFIFLFVVPSLNFDADLPSHGALE